VRYGIITILRDDQTQKISKTWADLHQACGLPDANLSPVPHLTWHIANNYDLPALKEQLSAWCARRRSFWLRAAGLGVFTAPEPVLYIPVIKNPRLLRFHQDLLRYVLPLAGSASEYYAPEGWIPHITLAFGNLEPETMGCAVKNLAFRLVTIDFKVDQLILVHQDSHENWNVRDTFSFGKSYDR
jgi:2'-5' RNA ligase